MLTVLELVSLDTKSLCSDFRASLLNSSCLSKTLFTSKGELAANAISLSICASRSAL